MKKLFEQVLKALDSAVEMVKPEYLFIGIPALLLLAFAVFALCRLASRARKDRRMFSVLAKQVSEKRITDADDIEALGKALSDSSAHSFRWKRLCASDTLTAYDVFQGKRRKARSTAFGIVEAAIALVGAAFLFLYKYSTVPAVVAYGITLGQAVTLTAAFGILAAVLVAIYSAINGCQAKKAAAAERAFAEAVAIELPVAKRRRLLGNAAAEPAPVRAFRVEEVKAEHVEEEAPAPEAEETAAEPAPEAEPAKPAPEDGAVAVHSENSVDEIIRKINEVRNNGASIQTMQQIAMLLQKEREKKENKTVAQQRRLNEALAELLRAMSRYQK